MSDIVSRQSPRSLPALVLYIQYQDLFLVVLKSRAFKMCLGALWNPVFRQEVSRMMLNRTFSSAILRCCDGLPGPTPEE